MTCTRTSILLIDDEMAHLKMMEELLSGEVDQILTATSGEDGLRELRRSQVDLVFLDMRMPGMGGIETLEAMRKEGLSVPTVVLTAFGEIDDAVRAMKLGAADYLRKPIDLASLKDAIDRCCHRAPEVATHPGLPPIPKGAIFESPLMLEVLADLARIAPRHYPVLLVGETGTGKEVLARMLHDWGTRPEGPLVPVNLAALPETLLERELFGHARGAFTGADRDQPGLVEAACGGSLFLDEIGEMPLSSQPKLLRLLESGVMTRIGETRERLVDFRLISATNRDLEENVSVGKFRQDLYYRLAVITVEVPPLRERVEDILGISRHILSSSFESPKRLTAESEAFLLSHHWPGNIRELRNTLLRAAILAPGDSVLPEHLPAALTTGAQESRAFHRPEEARSLASIEKQAILEALERCEGNRTRAAKDLGISRRKLLYRLSEYRRTDENAPGDSRE